MVSLPFVIFQKNPQASLCVPLLRLGSSLLEQILAFPVLVVRRKKAKVLAWECLHMGGGKMSFRLSLLASDGEVVCIESTCGYYF